MGPKLAVLPLGPPQRGPTVVVIEQRAILRWSGGLLARHQALFCPEVIVLGLDIMVMDNDEALAREGCQPTYKEVKGFQPLQLTWGPFVIDALFRGGKKNGNAGDLARKLVERAVKFLREHYREDVPILVRMDAGFFDQKALQAFQDLDLGYLASARRRHHGDGLRNGSFPAAHLR